MAVPGEDDAYRQLLRKAADLRRMNLEINQQTESLTQQTDAGVSSRQKVSGGLSRQHGQKENRSPNHPTVSTQLRSKASASEDERPGSDSSEPVATVPPPRAVSYEVPTTEVMEPEEAGEAEDIADAALGERALARLQRARITALQSQLSTMLADKKAVDNKVGQLEREIRSLVDDKRKLQARLKTCEASLERGLKQQSEEKATSQQVQQQVESLERELGASKKAVRHLETDAKNKEVRLNRALEEVERLKTQLAAEKGKSRSEVSQEKKEMERMETELRRVERQKNELLMAFRKQLKLIEVLKRQKAHLEAARLLAFTEEEFSAVLGDWCA